MPKPVYRVPEPDFECEGVKLYRGDCLWVLPRLREKFTACVCDPPYGLEFMGKEWDRLWNDGSDSFSVEKKWGRRPAGNKPRYVVNRKCRKCGKWARDKRPCTCPKPDWLLPKNAKGEQHQLLAMQQWHQQWAEAVLHVLKPGAPLLAFGGTRTFHRLICAIEDAGFEIRDCLMWVYGSGFPKSLDISKAIDKAAGAEREVVEQNPNWRTSKSPIACPQQDEQANITTPATEAAKLWDGWGTGLKPAWEPICLAMKPLDGTFASNALEHWVAGLNVDGCRVGAERVAGGSGQLGSKGIYGVLKRRKETATTNTGRWPANLVHDGSEEVLGLFPVSKDGVAVRRNAIQGEHSGNTILGARNNPPAVDIGYGSFGSAARFFYCAKSSKKDRTCNGKVKNSHPTVKPRALMEWLCRLVTPPQNGLILDPFMGSGSTGIGALMAGSQFVGIEKDEDSFNTAVERIEAFLEEQENEA